MTNVTKEDPTPRRGFFNIQEDWQEHWKKMPAFHQDNHKSFSSLHVHFATAEDREAFGELIGRKITPNTRSTWYPPREAIDNLTVRYVSKRGFNPRFPVYVISKGRWESRLTIKTLEALKIPYHVVIEPQEYKQYSTVIAPENILQLPFSNLGQGSIPARNWVWEHAIKTGANRHWILDDNIRDFYRLCNNRKVRVADGAIFRAAEDFVERYTNVAIAGFHYSMFIPRAEIRPPYYLNTRVYSCILIRNDLSYRWRGRYNEDTDLSIRALKDGWCTILFNAFLADKMATMTMKGGNTESLYQEDGRFKMAQSLLEQHPDIVSITRKWGRWQHSVDYSVFRKNRLKLKPNLTIMDGVDDYGMSLVGTRI